MSKQMPFSPEIKLNFRMRDFFLDFMACIVPGLTFILFITTIVGGLFIIAYKEIPALPGSTLSSIFFSNLLGSFAFNFWFTLIVIFLAYFAGHSLYRQNPKRPDYASFLRIRREVMSGKNDVWVIERDKGIRTQDVQFPYSNLRQYLEKRGFQHLAGHVKWGAGASPNNPEAQRSKTFINSAKMRVSFFFPDQTNNLLRNEAHIRLASSMWYASKYTIKSAYVCIFLTLLILLSNNISFSGNLDHKHAWLAVSIIILVVLAGVLVKIGGRRRWKNWIWVNVDRRSSYVAAALILSTSAVMAIVSMVGISLMSDSGNGSLHRPMFVSFLILALVFGKLCKFHAASILHRYPITADGESLPQDGELVQRLADRIDTLWKIYDRTPAFVLFMLLVYLQFNYFDIHVDKLHSWYAGVVLFVLLGAMFAKHYIEESIHYQRVRELVYVLETAHIAKVLNYENLPDPLKIERLSYEVRLHSDNRLNMRL